MDALEELLQTLTESPLAVKTENPEAFSTGCGQEKQTAQEQTKTQRASEFSAEKTAAFTPPTMPSEHSPSLLPEKKKTPSVYSGISHLRTETTAVLSEIQGETLAEPLEKSEEKTTGLTERDILTLLDRYLTEEFLGTGGMLFGND